MKKILILLSLMLGIIGTIWFILWLGYYLEIGNFKYWYSFPYFLTSSFLIIAEIFFSIFIYEKYIWEN